MTMPNAPERRAVVGDLAQVHAALRVTQHFFDSVGLSDLPTADREALRENVEFIIGRAIVQNCSDDQLDQLEQEVRKNGTLEALRWLYGAAPERFRDAVRTGLSQLVDRFRGRYASAIVTGAGGGGINQIAVRQRASSVAAPARDHGSNA